VTLAGDAWPWLPALKAVPEGVDPMPEINIAVVLVAALASR
jgi:hypothetical protein